jgi:quinol-cytochrome oxidoreductase complex cytochrome b subunit
MLVSLICIVLSFTLETCDSSVTLTICYRPLLSIVLLILAVACFIAGLTILVRGLAPDRTNQSPTRGTGPPQSGP